MIVAVAARKGSPGVTSLSALIAAYWHQSTPARLLLEADPSGGSLAARWSDAHGLTWDPGLLALSTSRRVVSTELLPSVAQQVADGLWVCAAPPGADQVRGGLQRLADAGAAQLASAPDLLTIADCGRLVASSPAMPLARRAAVLVVVCRPRLDEVHALVPAVAELRQSGCSPALVCLGDRPYDPIEVAGSLGVELLGTVPVDERAAAALDGDGLTAGRALRRSRLVDAVEELVSRLQVRCADALAIPGLDRAPGPLDAGTGGPTGAPDHGPQATANIPAAFDRPPAQAVDGPAPGAATPSPPGPPDGGAEAEGRLVAAGMEGPLSPAMMAARASAAARMASSDRERLDE